LRSIRIKIRFYIRCLENYCKADYAKYPPLLPKRRDEWVSVAAHPKNMKLKGTSRRSTTNGGLKENDSKPPGNAPSDNLRKRVKLLNDVTNNEGYIL